jgi:hypothetical protein
VKTLAEKLSEPGPMSLGWVLVSAATPARTLHIASAFDNMPLCGASSKVHRRPPDLHLLETPERFCARCFRSTTPSVDILGKLNGSL